MESAQGQERDLSELQAIFLYSTPSRAENMSSKHPHPNQKNFFGNSRQGTRSTFRLLKIRAKGHVGHQKLEGVGVLCSGPVLRRREDLETRMWCGGAGWGWESQLQVSWLSTQKRGTGEGSRLQFPLRQGSTSTLSRVTKGQVSH